MEEFTFENLPVVVGKLYLKVDKIEQLLQELSHSHFNKSEELLTIEAAAKFLKLSVATIYSKVCRNEIPANKQGKRLYFYRTELLEWISAGRIKTITEIQNELRRDHTKIF